MKEIKLTQTDSNKGRELLPEEITELDNAVENHQTISELKVMHSNAGYYLGHTIDQEIDGQVFEMPWDRMTGYYKTQEQAEQALRFEQLHQQD